MEVVETHRSEEPLGMEERSIDNTRSTTTVTRTLKASKEWTRNYSIDLENVRRGSVGLSIQVLKADVEKTLREKYSLTEQVHETYGEEIGLTVPARTRVRLVLHWKRIWQHGIVRITYSDNRIVEVPFELAVGITFDQDQLGD